MDGECKEKLFKFSLLFSVILEYKISASEERLLSEVRFCAFCLNNSSNFQTAVLSALKYPALLAPFSSKAINISFNCGARWEIKSKQIGVISSPSSIFNIFEII